MSDGNPPLSGSDFNPPWRFTERRHPWTEREDNESIDWEIYQSNCDLTFWKQQQEHRYEPNWHFANQEITPEVTGQEQVRYTAKPSGFITANDTIHSLTAQNNIWVSPSTSDDEEERAGENPLTPLQEKC